MLRSCQVQILTQSSGNLAKASFTRKKFLKRNMNRYCKVKRKIVPVLFFKWAPRHESILGEWRYSSTHSLSWTVDRGEWSATRPGRLTPRERAPGTHWIGGWKGPRAGLDGAVKRKIPSPRRESNPITPIVQPVAQRYTDWAIAALNQYCKLTNY
jgi:hypothetical protein